MQQSWAARADLAEQAITTRHVRRLWGVPGTALGIVGWPAVRRERGYVRWHYWWQAHLIDCSVDSALRSADSRGRRRVARLTRSVRMRNLGRWTNAYYDDMAWLGLVLQRAQQDLAIDNRRALAALEERLMVGFNPVVGALPWRTYRRPDQAFFNVPANGPAAILLVRTGRVWRAEAMADWMHATLRDPETGLMFDGIHADGSVERKFYSYCQGVVLGAETELAVAVGDERHVERVRSLVDAVDRELCVDSVITGGGGGDGGLFNGILARYLALVARDLPGHDAATERARAVAAHIVLTTAENAWYNRLQIEGLPLFGRDWSQPATLPTSGSAVGAFRGGTVLPSEAAERDLSVQLGGWMLMEAAAAISPDLPGEPPTEKGSAASIIDSLRNRLL